MSGIDPRNGTVLCLALAKLKRGTDQETVLAECMPLVDHEYVRSVLRCLCGYPARGPDVREYVDKLKQAYGIA